MDKEEFIAIPHFINPHLFWYHTVDGQSPKFIELQRIEESVQTLFTATQRAALHPHKPVVGEIVAVAFVSWNKFIRARVDYIAKYSKIEDEYVVWALDYGFPFQTKQCYVRKLPNNFAQISDHIRLGGLADVVPAELDFDFVTTTSKLVRTKSWPQRAVDLLEKVINDAASISFVESFCTGDARQKQHFGDLKIINHSGDEFFVSDYLIKLNYAVNCRDNFREILNTLQTVKVPCWQTNSKNMKIIENKLNTLNVHYAHQGKFDLSGTLSESSCDMFSKQKVMDWCERNENYNSKKETNADALCPVMTLDASDISFDDSVSVSNFKVPGRRPSFDDETVMCYAGAIHESRRKKYEGKGLPPKPAMEVFEVISENKKTSQDDRKTELKNSGSSSGSVQSQKIKALIELRKKHQELVKEKENANILQDEMTNLCISPQSDAGTLSFLEACKKKNAQSARLQKLKELKRRRAEDVCSKTESASIIESVEEENSNTTSSSRHLHLKEIREKLSKNPGNNLEIRDAAIENSIPNRNTDGESQSESIISAHTAKLIRLRKKQQQMKDSQTDANSIDKSASAGTASAVRTNRGGYKMPQQSPKFTKLEFTKMSQDYVKSPLAKPQEMRALPDKNLTSELGAGSQSSSVRENELRNLRKLVNENPFQNMTMVPAGFDVTKLTKRRDEENHWHTKKTTLNDSLHSNYSTEEHQSGRHNNSLKFPVPRRTEDVEEQNFRLTRYRKERHKGHAGKSNEKHILDLSLNDFDCPPAITPVVVSDRNPKECQDLVVVNNNDVGKEGSTGDHTITNCGLADRNQIENLIDLSTASEVLEVSNGSGSSDSFLKFVKEKNSVRDTSKEQLLETTVTSEDSLNLLPPLECLASPETEEKIKNRKRNASCKESLSSNSSNSFIKLGSATQNSEMCNKWLQKVLDDVDRNYEPCSTSASSGLVATKIAASSINKPVVDSLRSDSAEILAVSGSAVKKDLPLTTAKNPVAQENLNPIEDPSYATNLTWIVKSTASTEPNEMVKIPNLFETDSPSHSRTTEKSHSSSSSSIIKSYPLVKRSTQTLSTDSTKCNASVSHLPEIDGEASLKSNFIQHLVLAHSTVKVNPIERMTNALFSPEVHQEMEHMRLTKMYRIQSYAWAHLVRGNSFFVINASRTGKTWCYLPPVCSMVGFRLETQCLPQTYGPVAVVIVPSSVQVESITRQCRRLLASSKTKVTIVPSYAFREAEAVKIELHNGCGILVITPPSLKRLLVANERESLFNMERIQYVIIDDLDTMMSQDGQFDETLHKFIGPVVQHQENGKVPFQMVVTSKRWSRRMINLLRISNQPLLCIADYLEAAVYAKSKISIKLQSSVEKMTVLVKCMEKCPYNLERVAIICSTYDEVDEVEKHLLEAGYSCLAYTERMSAEYNDLIFEWKIKTICDQVLITTDSVLPELMIQNVWTLIHYSLPTSWTKFNFRFSVFLKNYENLLTANFDKPTKVPRSLILLDEENNAQLPRLIEFMKHHNQLKHVHPDILNVAARVTAEREESRVSQGILMCPKILEFGSCDQSSKCHHRHQLTKYDGAVEGIPTHGEVRLQILDVLSPTHYTARLLTHKVEKNWVIARRSNEVTHFLMQLSLHFMNEDAHVIHWPLRVNDLCVYRGEGVFHRCRLLEVPPILYENIVKLVNVKVKLIDSGKSVMCKSHDILAIPEQFKDFPGQAVDIRLSGVVPFDNERAWDTRSTRTVKKWIMTDVTDKDCLQASINFALMDTIWVNNLILMEKLTAISGYMVKTNVRRSLLGKEFALADDGLLSVKQIALENGLLKVTQTNSKEEEESVEKYEKEDELLGDQNLTQNELTQNELTLVPMKKPDHILAKDEVPKQVVEEWMRLELDGLLQVKLNQLHDPSKFYVCLMNQDEELKELEEMIRTLKKVPLKDPHPMQNCLAPREGQYYRAKIQRLIVDSAEECVQARVFFCDLGLFSNYPLEKLRSSSKVLTEYIPFQAISCKLTGLHVDCVGEEVQKMIHIEEGIHFAYAVKEISDSEDYDEGFYIRTYGIILYECCTGKSDIQINKLLVEHGLASYDEETKHFLELESKVNFTNFDYQHSETDNSFEFQRFLDALKQQIDEDDAEEEEMHNSAYKAIKEAQSTEPNIVEISTDSSVEVLENPSPQREYKAPTLKTLHKRPRTTWYETLTMIYLVIHAPDISDYHLEVTPKRLIFVAIVNAEKIMLILDLLGCVEPDQVTHEIRGLNVVVRLLKSVYMEWPRLLDDPTKFSWLTYNFNAIDAIEAENGTQGKCSSRSKRNMVYSSDESTTSESNPCETFTTIVNADELLDPMAEFY